MPCAQFDRPTIHGDSADITPEHGKHEWRDSPGSGDDRCGTTRAGALFVQSPDAHLGLDGRDSSLQEWKRGRSHGIFSPGDVDDTEDAAGQRVVHGNRRATPGVHDAIEMFGTADLDAVVQREGGSGRTGPDSAFRPVRALDEEHALRLATKCSITIDPEQPAGFVTDRDDQPRVESMTDQQAVDGRERECHRVRAAVLVQVILVETDRCTELIRV